MRDAYGRNGFGQRALLARRLVEAGVPFITLYDGGWDHHSKLFDALKKRLPTWDQTVAALIDDLDQRGLLDSTLVIALGEFGRTPQINKDGGRDHWSNAMSVLFAGGRTPGGQVIGATDRQGFAAVERVLSPENFASTIYTKLGIDPDKILYTPQRPTVAPGQRSDADQGVDGLIRLALSGLLLLCASFVHAAAPTLTGLYPAGGQRGTTVEGFAIGTFDSWPVQFWTSSPLITVTPGKDKGKLSIKLSKRYSSPAPTGFAVTMLKVLVGFVPSSWERCLK